MGYIYIALAGFVGAFLGTLLGYFVNRRLHDRSARITRNHGHFYDDNYFI